MKIKDPLILGAFAGLTANLGKMLGNVFNKNVLKVSDINYSELAAGIFMTEKELKKPAGLVVGTLADFVIGAIMGIPIVYILRYTGKDHAALKGFGFVILPGLLIWSHGTFVWH